MDYEWYYMKAGTILDRIQATSSQCDKICRAKYFFL
jgi:hypothetical protein